MIYQRKPFPDTDLSRCGDWGENDIGALFLHFKELSDEFRSLFAFLVKNLADNFRFNRLFECGKLRQGLFDGLLDDISQSCLDISDKIL